MKLICIQWPRFGPVHINRLRSAHAACSAAGIDLVALETASDSNTYDWRREEGALPFRRETVFAGQNYDDVSPRGMHRGVFDHLESLQPDVILIHSYSTPDARAALAWCRVNRRVAINMAESTAHDAPRVAIRESIKRVFVRQFDSALTSGSRSTEYAVDLGIPRDVIFRGYSVVDNDYFSYEAERHRSDTGLARHLPGLQDPSPFFLASARFMPRKNLDTLLAAYGRYRQAHQDAAWRLILLGDGELRPQLEAQLRRDSIEGVLMPGWRQLEDLPAYYAHASAFVHTADVDQWGLVINEAMAAGLPVIVSTGTGCSPDLVFDGENGYVFEPRDTARLAHCMGALAHSDDREAMARRSVEIISQWPLEMFGRGLVAAARAGASRADRGLDPRAAALIWGLKTVARGPRAFHSVQD
jgi:1,2-diacylglycerol 3-alpha-glucosyltransferase